VKLPRRQTTSPISGTISAAALRRHISSKAVREMARSEQKLQQGDIQSSIAHLKKAIRIQPDYMEAYNNLGTRYMALQNYEREIAQFRVAFDVQLLNEISRQTRRFITESSGKLEQFSANQS
jgi:tetratricopeptide (TPR) repeat protein